jgi:hypothetical protein
MPLHAGAAIDALRRVEESLAAEDREGQIRCGADGGLREQGDPVQILEGSTPYRPVGTRVDDSVLANDPDR